MKAAAVKMLIVVVLILLFSKLTAQIACNDCNTVTTFTVDLSSNPENTWLSPNVARSGPCCSGTNCIRFIVYTHPTANELSWTIESGAAPGGQFYQVDCGPLISAGSPLCVSGAGPYCIVYCKTGADKCVYRISSGRTYAGSPDITVPSGCTGQMWVEGLTETSITWNSIFPTPSGAYNGYLDFPFGSDTVNVTPEPGYPPYVDYVVSGTASGCASGTVTDTIRVYIVEGMTSGTIPSDPYACAETGGLATVTATVTGGVLPITYQWSNSASTASTNLPAGTHYVTVSDNSTCPPQVHTVVVNAVATPDAPTISGASICEGATASLAPSAPGGPYEWFNAASGGTLLYTGNTYTTPALMTTTSYWVQSNPGCPGPRTEVIVTVNSIPAAPTASGTTICSGQTATLTATAPGGTYEWYDAASGGNLLHTGASYTTSVLTANTSFYVQTTVSGCTGPRTTVTVTVTPLPAAPTASGTTICQGLTATLNATAPGGTYAWYDAASGGTLLFTGASYTTPALAATTTYYVQTTVSGCAGPRTAVTVTVTPTPAAPTASGTTICQGLTATLNATAPGGTYAWYDAASGGTLLFTGASYTTPALAATTTYYVQTTVSGCAGPRTAVTVTVTPTPAAPTASGTTICQGLTATLNATAPGGTYAWYDAASGGTLLFTGASYTTPALAATTTYYVQTTVSGCAGPRTAVTVTVTPTPAAPTASGTTICQGLTATLNATAPGGTYAWYDAASGGTLLFTGASFTTPALAATTTYYVQTTVSGCAGPRTAVTVTVTPTPAAPTASGTTICQGLTATLNATAPGGTYAWYDAASGGTLLFTGASYTTPALAATTTYYVQTTVSGCTGPRTAVTVTVTPTPAAPTASGTTICQGLTATLTATAPGGTYAWYDAASGGTLLFTGASYTTPALAATTTYYVQTTVSGCAGPRTAVTVTVTPTPAAPTASGTTICQGLTATLNATAPGGTYAWYDAASGGTLLFTGASYTTPALASTTTYYFQTTVSGCAGPRTAVTVTVTPTPAAPTASGTTICQGLTATLNATAPGGTYAWYDAASGGTLLFTGASFTTPALAANTTYYVQSTISGCTGPRTSVLVTVTPTPVAPTATGTGICTGTTATLTATAPGGTYAWYNAASGGTLLYTGATYTTGSLVATTSFFVQTTVSGCTGPRTEVIVTVNPEPAAPTASGATICQGETATLTATAPGGVYEWYNASSGGTLLFTGASYTTPALISNTTYYVQSNVSGCIGPRTAVAVTVNPTPAAPTASGVSVCNGSTATLTATAPGGTYQWYDAASGGSLLFTGASFTTPALAVNTTYYVQTTIAGCTGPRTSVLVTVNPVPAAPTSSGTTICEGNSATLTATAPGGTYAWYDAASGGTLLFTGAGYTTPVLSATTTYYVQTTVLGCTSSRTPVTVTVNPTPAAPTATGTTICSGETATLTATAPGGTYEWYNAASGGTLLFTGASYTTSALVFTTTYYVQSVISGCEGPRTAVTVTVNPIPVAPTAAGTSICVNTSATLNATAPGGTYEWFSASSGGTPLFTGASYTTPVLASTTTYYVQTTVAGCTGPRTAVTVTVSPVPAAPTAAGTGICTGTTATLTATAPGGTYQWYSAASGGTLLFTGSSFTTPVLNITTSYFVQTTVGGCSGPRTEVVVTVSPEPAAPTAPGTTICQNNTSTLTASGSGGVYEWYNAASGGTLLFTGTDFTTPVLSATTSYWVQSNVSGCIGPRTQVTVTVTPTPATPTAAGTSICTGNTATLTATAPGGTYEWYDAASGGSLLHTGASFTTPALMASTTYYVQTTVSGCVSARRSVTVTVNPYPSDPSASGASICEGSTATISATAPGGTYQWYNAATGGTLLYTGASYTTGALSATTSFYVQTTVLGCTSSRTEVVVTVNPIPDAPTAAGTTICQGESTALTATAPGGTYAWYDAASGGNLLTTNASYITPNLNSTTTYYVQTTVTGCTSSRTAVTVNVTPTPANPTVAGTTICEGLTATVNATAPGGTYEWYDASTGGSLVYTGASYTTPLLTSTTSWYVQSTISGCTGGRTEVTVTVTPTDDPTFAYPSGTYCITGPNPLPVISGGFPGSFASSPAGIVFISTTTGEVNLAASALNTYTITYTTTGPCPDSYSVNLTITTAPDATFSYDNPYCQTGSNPLPTFPSGASAGLFTSSPSGLTFINNSTGEVDLASTTPGTYTITNTISAGGGCALEIKTATLVINPAATVNAGADQTVCENGVALLNGTIGGSATSASWSASSGIFAAPSILITNYSPQPGISPVWLVLTTDDPAGPCPSVSDSLMLTVTPLPVAPTATGTTICAGETATLIATAPGGTYAWYDASSGGNLVYTGQSFTTPVLTTTTTYYVQTTINNCAGPRTAVMVDVTPLPAAPTAADATICDGETAALSATAPGGAYEWYDASTGGNLLASNANYSTAPLSSTTSYYVQTTLLGCIGPREEVVVTVNPIPPAPTATDIDVCYGNSGTATATAPGGTYQWYDDATGGSLLFTGASYNTPVLYSDASYFVQTTVLGCTGARTEVTATVISLPDAPTASGVTVCQFESATLTATAPGGTYDWFDVATGGTSLYTGASFTTPSVAANTTYYVQTTVSGCPGPRTPVTVTITPLPDAPTASGATICEGETATLTATAPGGNYEWYDALTAGSLLGTGATYTTAPLAATSSFFVQTTLSGCTSQRTEVVVIVNPIPALPTVSAVSVCDGNTATLTATAPGGTYEWYDALTGGNLLGTGGSYTSAPLTATTTFYVQTTISGCTSDRQTVTVTVNPIPAAPSASGITVCQGQTATVTATAPGGTYRWYNAPSGGTLLFTGATYTTPPLAATTTYYVQTTVLGCASARTPVTVTVTPLPDAPTASGTTICEGFTATLTATAPGGDYEWYDAATGGNLLASGAVFTTPVLVSDTSFFVQTTLSGCAGPQTEVIVYVTPTDDPSFSYTSGTYCVSGANPLPTITGGYPGEFTSSPAGLVFVSTATGEIDVAASALNTYTVTFTTTGPCPDSYEVLLTVTDAPDATFTYTTPVCKTGVNPVPVFPVGSSAGEFSATPSGLNFVSTVSGEINLASTTPGVYTVTNFIAAAGGCIEAMATFDVEILTPATVNAGTDIITCDGFNVQLNGNIGGTASSATWTGGAGGFSDNTSLNAIYLPAVGEITVILTLSTDDPAGPCPAVSDNVSVTFNPIPAAPTSAGITICEGSTALLTATAPGGDYEWYDAASGGTLLSTADTLSTSPLTTTTSFFVNTTIGGCTSTMTDVVVDVAAGPVAEAGADQIACANNAAVVLTGIISGSASQGIWTTSGSGSFVPDEFTLNATYIPSAADTATGLVTLTITTSDQSSACTAVSDTMQITYTDPPWVFAGNNKYVCIGSNTTVGGQIISASGTGSWDSDGDGTFADPTSLSTVYTPGAGDIAAGFADLILTSTGNGTCNPVSDTMRIFLVVPPSVTAGSDQTACTNTPAVLNGSVSGTSTTGVWTTSGTGTFLPDSVALNATYQPSSADALSGTVTLTLTSTNSCQVSDNLTLTVLAAPIVNAGPNQAVCADATQFTLNGSISGITTTGIWTTTGTGTFDPGNTDLNAEYYITPADSLAGSVQFTLTSTNNDVCNSVNDVMILNITTVPDVDAGNDITWCANNSVQLSGQITGGMGTAYWSTSGTGTFVSDSSHLDAFYVFSDADTTAGSVVLTLTSTGACVVVSDQITITIDPAPQAFAGADISVCENNADVSLSGYIGGSGTTGIWSTDGDGTFTPSASDLNALYVPGTQDIVNGTVNLILTTDSVSNCYPGTDTLLVTITPAPVVNAGSNIYLCIGASAHLHGSVSGGNGTGIWQTAGDGTFTPNDSALNATYIPGSGDLTSGSVVLTLTSTQNGGCIAGSDDVLVTITDYPVVSAGSDLTICSNDSAAISGNVSGSTSTGYWATSGGGTFSPDSSYLNAYYLPDSADIANGNITLYLTSSLACAVTDSLLLTIIPAPVADAGNNQVICQGVVDVSLNGSVSNASSFEWSSSGTGSFSPDNTTLNATYTLSTADSLAGSVILVLSATGNPLCQVSYDSITVTTAGNIQLNAGNDTSICASAEIFLNGEGNAGTLYWSTSGTGTFSPDSSDLMAQYLFSDADTTAGSVLLVLNSQTSCGLYADSMTVTFTPVPYVDAGSDFTMCDNAEFIELTGIVSAGANTGVWTTDGTGYFDPHDSLLTVLYYPSVADLQLTTITFWLTSTNSNGCVEITDSVIATIEPSPVVDAGEDKTVCEGNNAALDGQISGTPGTGSWQTTGDGAFSPSPLVLNASYIPGSGDLTAGTVVLILTSDITANCSSVSDSLVVTFITPGTAAELIPLDSLCYGDSLYIIPAIQGDTGTFAWSTSGAGTFWPDTSAALPVYIPGEEDLASGSVLIFMHYTYACGSKDDTLTLNINPIPEAWFTYRTNCDNMNVMFIDSTQISSGSIVSWEWDFGDGTNGNSASVNHPYLLSGINQVTLAVQSASGCSDTITRPVQVFEPLLADFSVSDSTPAPGAIVNFNNESVNALNYFWTFGDNSGTSLEENPSYTYNTPGTYPVWLHAEGENNCSDSAMINIVINFAGYAVPTAFSPNGDGLNDFFFIRGGPFSDYELRVFNSWGQQVFISAEQQVQWDGTFKGKDLQEGVYVVIFRGKLTDGTELEFTGDITLVR